jgi:hypothetical protein
MPPEMRGENCGWDPPFFFGIFPRDWLFRVRRIDGSAGGVHHPCRAVAY